VKISTLDIQEDKTWSADVCIMGAGVAGITLANEFAQKGLTVCILDAGGEAFDENIQRQAKADKISVPYPDASHSRLRMLGGTSNHWANNTSPLSPIDFEKRDGLPNSGWPISFSDLSDYYEKAAVYCGTGSDGYDLETWHKRFKISPTISPLNTGNLKLNIAKAAVPPTRFYKEHGKNLDLSKETTLITFAQVTDLEFNEFTGKINRAKITSPGGRIHKVEAAEFIMAFGGLENARMLIHFNNNNKNKLGNSLDNVGRYFMDHPTLRAAHVYTKEPSLFTMFKGEMTPDYKRFVLNFFELGEGVLKEKELTNLRLPLDKANRQQLSHGVSSFHLLKEKMSGKNISGDLASHLTNLVMDFDVVADTISRKAWNKPVFDSVDDFAGFQVPLMMEQTAHRDNQVYLSNKKDRYGIPKLSIKWQVHQDDKDRLWRGLDVFSSELGALGLGRVRSLKDRESRLFDDQIGFGHHHMGTTRMSETSEKGVVDQEQRVFGVKNLSVAGCSVFATGGHVPPTLTIVATSIRLAEIVSKRINPGARKYEA